MNKTALESRVEQLKLQSPTMHGSVEETIKLQVVVPILRDIGWDVFATEEVVYEYRIEQFRVDIALRLYESTRVLVEVKAPREDLERHQEQLLKYAYQEGADLAVLSNGFTWWVYLATGNTHWTQRKIVTIDLREQKTDLIVKHLNDFLSKQSIESEKAVKLARSVHEDIKRASQLKEVIPRAWTELCSEPDELLLDLLTDKVAQICGFSPDSESVAEFLSKLPSPDSRGQSTNTRNPQNDSRLNPKESNKAFRTSPDGFVRLDAMNFTNTTPLALRIQNREIVTRKWKDCLTHFMNECGSHGPDLLRKISAEVSGKKRPYVTKQPELLRAAEEISGTGYFFETNLSAQQVAKIVLNILPSLGLDPDSVKVSVRTNS